MIKLEIESKENVNGKLMFSYDVYKYQRIIRVEVINKNGFTSPVCVEYALNNVTSDLIPVGEEANPIGTELIFDTEYPLCASQIFVSASPNDMEAMDVTIYAEEDFAYDCYPDTFDFDLEENYFLNNITVNCNGKGFADYTVYTSINGRDFDFLSSTENCPVPSENIVNADGREARIIRVYLEYCSVPIGCSVDVTFDGKKSGTDIVPLPPIDVPDFCDSEYNREITEDDTYAEVYGIIGRRLGKEYIPWFEFKLCKNPVDGHDYDFFELSYSEGKITVKGNNGVSLCTGLNYYLKYYCKVNISQVGEQVRMPDEIVVLDASVFKETKSKIRYAYNYCTFSYTMAFWGEEEWRRELDWLALNGVNLMLDLTAQEEVWRRFLTKIGYDLSGIKQFLTGPAYYAWLYMGNITTIGGPVHDSWFSQRTELARRNQLIMRRLGIMPVLQGYSGMLPLNIKEHDPSVPIIEQGAWGNSERPPMLVTTTDTYSRYADMFYECQREVYGNYSNYYATDPFHEGGRKGDMSSEDVSECVLLAMLKADEDAVWVIQSWQNNPSTALINGIKRLDKSGKHTLILDLYAEKQPNYTKGAPDNPNHGDSREFGSTPWLYCMLNNFGGRLGLHGHLDNLVKNIPIAFNTSQHLAGIGITPEASENNPLLYDFLFECIWQDNADMPLGEVHIDEWLAEYAQRRYGRKSDSAFEALKILKETVYKAELNMIGQGAPECVINSRPNFEIKSASTWGNSVIGYDASELLRALQLLEQDYDLLKDSAGYMYDLVTVKLQVLSNRALVCQKKLKPLFDAKDIDAFKRTASEFLSFADEMESVAALNEHYRLDRYKKQAERLARNTNDFTSKLYMDNLIRQITTWTSFSGAVRLRDYSNRQWSGMIADFYKPRWERWFAARINELLGNAYEDKIDWFFSDWHNKL